MGLECRNLGLQEIPNIDAGGGKREQDWLSVRQSEVGGSVIQFLSVVRRDPALQLVRITIRAVCLMKSKCREY